MPLKTINYLQSQGTFTFFHPRGNYEEKEDEKVVLSTVFVIITWKLWGKGRWEGCPINRVCHYKNVFIPFTCLSTNLIFLCNFPFLASKKH